MKKMLIVNKSFAVGGIESAMINMISNLHNDYDIDVCVYYAEGPLKDRVPGYINVIKANPYLEAIGMSFFNCMKNGTIKQKFFRIWSTIWTKIISNKVPIEFALKYQKMLTGYDVAIAYHHETDKHTINSGFTRFIDKCVIARKKVAWIHYDATQAHFDENYNESFYTKMDEIVFVSNSVRERFVSFHESLNDKTRVCYNFLDYEKIYRLCEEKMKVNYSPHNVNFFSACRLTPEKGIPRAIRAISPLLQKNKDVVWYIAGDGIEKTEIEIAINEEGLNNQIILLGNVDNPYSYMKNADALLVTSYHEAAPMVYLEAIALDTFIFTTEISSASEMLSGIENVVICENSEKGIHDSMEKLLENKKVLIAKRNRTIIYKNNDIQRKQLEFIS